MTKEEWMALFLKTNRLDEEQSRCHVARDNVLRAMHAKQGTKWECPCNEERSTSGPKMGTEPRG
jgi:hypothetical protein